MRRVNTERSLADMSSSYSANQYEGAFKSQKLQNWTVPKHFKERPCAVEGHTCFIANDRGHLLPELKIKRGSAWPDFRGTWELPARIPAGSVDPTSRSEEGRNRLSAWGLDPQRTTPSPTTPTTPTNTTPTNTTPTNTTTQPTAGPQDPADQSQGARPTTPRPSGSQTPRPSGSSQPTSPRPDSQRSRAGERTASQACSERAASQRDASEERTARGASAGRERPASLRAPSEPQTQMDQ